MSAADGWLLAAVGYAVLRARPVSTPALGGLAVRSAAAHRPRGRRTRATTGRHAEAPPADPARAA